MRISDWSSDVCSSDLGVFRIPEHAHRLLAARDFGAPARGVDIHLPQLLVHLAGGQAIALHPRGIEDHADFAIDAARAADLRHPRNRQQRSEEHTSGLQSLMRISYAVFCLKKKK